jgi:BioD-like phosphotransacetylase family protein
MKTLYVTSNQNSAGKTTFCSAFGSLIQQDSKKIAVIKPVSISNHGDQDTDSAFYDSLFKGTPKKLSPIQISQDSVSNLAQKRQEEIVESINNDVTSLRKAGLSVVVEGLPTHDENGIQITITQAIVKSLDCNVVSITTFNQHAGKHASELMSLFPKGVAGTIINNVSKYKHHKVNNELIPSIEGAGVRVLASIPEHRYLMAKTVLELSKIVRGEIVQGKEHQDRLVEHIMIGGLILGSSNKYFGKYSNKAVVVRGNRPDIQMAALTGDTSCLILTGGYLPTQYVEYEASETNVPIIYVENDTHSVTDALNAIDLTSPCSDTRKVSRFQSLLKEHSEPSMLTDLANLT